MGQQSDKHGPRLDDELEHETHGMVTGGGPTHAERFKDPEPVETDSGDDPTTARGSVVPGAPPGMTADDVEARSAIARALVGVRYPASPEELAAHVGAGAPDGLAERLWRLPSRQYQNIADVAQALGLGHEQRRT
jgi:hypothetical protein